MFDFQVFKVLGLNPRAQSLSVGIMEEDGSRTPISSLTCVRSFVYMYFSFWLIFFASSPTPSLLGDPSRPSGRGDVPGAPAEPGGGGGRQRHTPLRAVQEGRGRGVVEGRPGAHRGDVPGQVPDEPGGARGSADRLGAPPQRHGALQLLHRRGEDQRAAHRQTYASGHVTGGCVHCSLCFTLSDEMHITYCSISTDIRNQ